MKETRLYDDLAAWWPLLSAPGEYAEEAGYYRDILVEACDPRTVLELGSGGGNNAYHLKRHFELTLVDLSPGMLAVSRALNPDCDHRAGDMRSVRLGREFDAVFIHDAVMYLTTEEDLFRALETAFVHCRPGGAVLIAPDDVLETFRPETSTGGHDGDGRSLRYIQWSCAPEPGSPSFTVDFAYLLREGSAPVRVVSDRHEQGLFPRRLWLELCSKAGFEAEVRSVVHSELAPRKSELFLCRRPRL